MICNETSKIGSGYIPYEGKDRDPIQQLSLMSLGRFTTALN